MLFWFQEVVFQRQPSYSMSPCDKKQQQQDIALMLQQAWFFGLYTWANLACISISLQSF